MEGCLNFEQELSPDQVNFGTGWYSKAREKTLKKYLAGIPENCSVLDVGCGDGLVTRMLPGHKVVGVDTEARYDGVITCSAERLPFESETFDYVTCLDVLEHVDGHLGAIREIKRVLKAGGRALISVPLHRWLWSSHDELVGHVRRYRQGELKKLLQEKGFRITRQGYFLCLLLPAVIATRLMFPGSASCSAVSTKPILEKALAFVCDLERKIQWPTGLTEIVEAVKPGRSVP